MLSIITPIYNRACLLPRIYDCLCSQSSKDFEWIIVDDGSTDNVRAVFEKMQPEEFTVRLFQKVNGGKHTAVNMGIKEAKGELTLILDSDDELPEDAVATVSDAYKTIEGAANFAGVCGYMAHRDGRIIGLPLVEADFSEIELRYRYHVYGDMCEVFRTDVLREFPFPELKGERFCPESLVWNRIARKYKLHVFPKVIYLRDYIDGGLTDNIVRIRMQSPIASMMTYAEMVGLDIPWRQKMKAAINYYRFKACLSAKHASEVGCNIPALSPSWYWTKPLGLLMHIKDAKGKNDRKKAYSLSRPH